MTGLCIDQRRAARRPAPLRCIPLGRIPLGRIPLGRAPVGHALGLLAILAGLGLGGCGGGFVGAGPMEADRGGRYKIGAPYEIGGRTYTPRVDYDYDRTGIASWYGRKFHGKATANGEIFDMHALTAAHKTLPLPSLVRVTNLENGRSAVLRVNDRGPFVGDRLIDLSHAAARRLGFADQGLARVRVTILREPSLALARGDDPGPVGEGEAVDTRPPGRLARGAPARSPDLAPDLARDVDVDARLAPRPAATVSAASPPGLPIRADASLPLGGAPGISVRPDLGAILDGLSRPALTPDSIPDPDSIPAPDAAASARAPSPALAPAAAKPPVPGSLGPDGGRAATSAAAPDLYIQVGSFTNRANAERLGRALSDLAPARLSRARVEGRIFWRLQLGPVHRAQAALRLRDAVIERGHGSPEIRAIP